MDVSRMFGESAGKVWNYLMERGPSSERKLRRKTKLEEREFFGAIGWLAREDKIAKERNIYMIGRTNLTWEIGSRAGKVWKALSIWGELSEDELSNLLDMERREVLSALGWLAREDKVEFVNNRWRLKEIIE